MEEKERETGYVVPHTHWDREWRYPIWKTRMLLVEFMEELLGILDADPEYKCFLMDGQAAPIEDYLEVVPGDRERVLRYVKAGRIAVGPWYTLPDLYPVDGECLVRNLLVGTRMAEAYGACLKIGYTSFGWGQTAQLPQIYALFGFDFIVCAKKVSAERAPESEFLWEAPDGTQVLTTRLGRHARGNFYFEAYLFAKYSFNCLSPEFRFKPGFSGSAMRSADASRSDEDGFMIEAKEGFDPSRLKQAMAAARATTEESLSSRRRLYLNGTDFSTPHPELTAMIREINALEPDKLLLSASLEDYAQALREDLDPQGLRVIRGELRDGPSCDCSGNALASRIYLKILNRGAQDLLVKKAEPLASVLSRLGGGYPKGFFDAAWKQLLAAHPHDSINGVTQDKTADDVEYRLRQAAEMGQVLYDKAVSGILLRMDLSSYDAGDTLLALFNPLPFPAGGIIKACVATPAEDCVWDFGAEDSEGAPLAVQGISRDEKVYPIHDREARPWPDFTTRHLVYLETGTIPALGYSVVRIVPRRRFEPDHFYWLPMRKSSGGDISPADGVLENEYLRAAFRPDGSVDLVDKERGAEYRGLHYFEDSGDVGNYWAYYAPYENRTFTTRGCATRQWLEDNGPLSATIGVEYLLEIPAGGHEPQYGLRGKSDRSRETATLRITSRFTLDKGSRRLAVKTTMTNCARYHRLRLAFPTGIAATSACASGHFTVDERPALPTKDEKGEYWPEMATLPMQHFVDVHDGEVGLALLNKGLTEYELRADEASTLYLTLFRAMGNMIVTWWEAVGVFPDQAGSQTLRDLSFEYALYPHGGDWARGRVYREADAFASGIAAYQVSHHGSGSLPRKLGFLEIEPDKLELSALKKAEEGESLILRVYNPTKAPVSGRIAAGFPIERAWETRLDEVRLRELEVEGGKSLLLDLGAGQILSIELE
jgi:mannosylglycerate hydrolase